MKRTLVSLCIGTIWFMKKYVCSGKKMMKEYEMGKVGAILSLWNIEGARE